VDHFLSGAPSSHDEVQAQCRDVLHTEDAVVIHKPAFDLETNAYRKAERSKNDIAAPAAVLGRS
jgi:hypothetical protein